MESPIIAEPAARLLARFIDLTIWTILWVVSLMAVSTISSIIGSLDPWRSLVGPLLALVAITVYELFLTQRLAATFGKLALQIHVESIDGYQPSPASAALRFGPLATLAAFSSVAAVRPFALLILGGLLLSSAVMLFVDPLRQVAWDRLSKTVVVKTPRKPSGKPRFRW